MKKLCCFIQIVLLARVGSYTYDDQRVGRSKHYEELELDTFKKKVFKKDIDVLVHIYGDQCQLCHVLQPDFEKAAERVKRKSDKIKFTRYDLHRNGGEAALKKKFPDFYSEPLFDEKTGHQGFTLPRVYLVKAGESKPVRLDRGNFDDHKLLYKWLRDHNSAQEKMFKRKGKNDEI
eukprot:TRINITY_DN49868_c0_g1_i1.p1 TRINITY_DN49868_c0_g1~~TRINITY_DN49868_c0_g1_i1.p1  ORF type:complete len:176 (+),score=32.33 TRINITY_DN49868_c0_g1_i1:29-556(+)